MLRMIFTLFFNKFSTLLVHNAKDRMNHKNTFRAVFETLYSCSINFRHFSYETQKNPNQ